MPKPDDFRQPTTTRSSVKCYVTGWGRRTESKSHFLQSQIRDVGIVFLYFQCINFGLYNNIVLFIKL